MGWFSQLIVEMGDDLLIGLVRPSAAYGQEA